jgi:phage shock protein PspC (stress-responsive transcriptional regulator)
MENALARAHDLPMDTVNDTDPPTATPPPYHRPDHLSRATDDKVVAGVAGGLGRYFGIDPVVFRIAFVVMALAGGSGVLLYALAWLLVPDDTGKGVLRRVGRERNQKLVTAVLIGGGALILFDQLGNRRSGNVPIGLVLVAIGALVLWSRHDGSGGDPLPPTSGGGGGAGRYVAPMFTPPPPSGASTPASPVEPSAEAFGEPPLGPSGDPAVDSATEAPTRPMPFTSVTSAAPAAPPAPAPVARAKATRERKPRSVLVPVTLSLLAVLAGGLSLLGVSARTGLALALLLTGGALVVGTWRGRGRWLIPVGLVLAVALAAASIIDVPVEGGTGDAPFRPLTVADVTSPYRLAAGHLTVDLSALDLSATTDAVTVVASVATGYLEVVVPPGAAVDIDAHVGAGNLQLLGRPTGGFDVGRRVSEPGPDGTARLVLRVRVGMGQVEVRRAAP